MDKFLERHNIPVLTQENMSSLNNLMSVKEIELIVKLGPHDFAHKLYQTLKEY